MLETVFQLLHDLFKGRQSPETLALREHPGNQALGILDVAGEPVSASTNQDGIGIDLGVCQLGNGLRRGTPGELFCPSLDFHGLGTAVTVSSISPMRAGSERRSATLGKRRSHV